MYYHFEVRFKITMSHYCVKMTLNKNLQNIFINYRVYSTELFFNRLDKKKDANSFTQ